MTAVLEEALKNGVLGAELVALINSKVGESAAVPTGASIVLKAALDVVFQGPAASHVLVRARRKEERERERERAIHLE